jgi:hypothetical protein
MRLMSVLLSSPESSSRLARLRVSLLLETSAFPSSWVSSSSSESLCLLRPRPEVSLSLPSPAPFSCLIFWISSSVTSLPRLHCSVFALFNFLLISFRYISHVSVNNFIGGGKEYLTANSAPGRSTALDMKEAANADLQKAFDRCENISISEWTWNKVSCL